MTRFLYAHTYILSGDWTKVPKATTTTTTTTTTVTTTTVTTTTVTHFLYSLYSVVSLRNFTICRPQYLAEKSPPCPSYTAKNEWPCRSPSVSVHPYHDEERGGEERGEGGREERGHQKASIIIMFIIIHVFVSLPFILSQLLWKDVFHLIWSPFYCYG